MCCGLLLLLQTGFHLRMRVKINRATHFDLVLCVAVFVVFLQVSSAWICDVPPSSMYVLGYMDRLLFVCFVFVSL